MSSDIVRKCSRRIFCWCAFLGILIPGIVVHSWIGTPIGWIEGVALSVCLLVLGILLFKVVSAQNPSTVIRNLQAQPLSGEDTPEVLASVHRFSEMAGVPPVRAYQSSANQMATLSVGWSPAHSIIVLNARVLEVLTAEERDSVIAIEIAHIKFRDHFLRSMIMSTAGLGYLCLGGMCLQILGAYRDIRQDIRNGVDPHVLSDRRLFYLIGTPAALGLIPLVLMFGIPIRAVIAEQEYRADAWSAQAMGSVLAPASAISKLAALVAAPSKRIRDYSVFFVAEPRSRNWIQSSLYSFLYPNYVARTKRLRASNKMTSIRSSNK